MNYLQNKSVGSNSQERRNQLTPWLMGPGGLMPHSQGLSNNLYPEPYQSNSSYFFEIHSNIVLPSTPRLSWRSISCRFSLPANILKAVLLFSTLATWPVYHNIIDLITLAILGEHDKLWSSHCGALSIPLSHPSWAQIFASGSCFQISLACI